MRVCSVPDCPELVSRNEGSRCRKHRQEHERRRGTRQARGYDARHDQLRTEWAPKVATGRVVCWRCGERIGATDSWDLGHNDNDRSRYAGPEHANQCNRSAAGRKSHN